MNNNTSFKKIKIEGEESSSKVRNEGEKGER